MSFSTEWDTLYQTNKQVSVWPWTELVVLVMKYKPREGVPYVLELGCGTGANISFFLSLPAHYYGVDGSETAVRFLHEKYPALREQIQVADFVHSLPFEPMFDLIVDRSSLTHNTTNSIKQCIELIYQRLKPGGLFIGIDWFSTRQSDYNKGRVVDDFTQCDFPEGFFYQTGNVHFSTEEHIRSLFSQFEFLHLEHKEVQQRIPDPSFRMARFHFVVKKPDT